MAKIQKALFFKNIKNSPLFHKNMGEEQKKMSSKFFRKNKDNLKKISDEEQKTKVFIFFGKNYGFQNHILKKFDKKFAMENKDNMANISLVLKISKFPLYFSNFLKFSSFS
jgi:hypothetical protein